ncbi:hypothetical protein FEDK69T_14130 [Flavobacterium enshiense DK69]|nr:hypothetical protein FEDK69T_14130 [Flavobacterium enshiense DK69]
MHLLKISNFNPMFFLRVLSLFSVYFTPIRIFVISLRVYFLILVC